MSSFFKKTYVLALMISTGSALYAQQVADTTFTIILTSPNYASGKGPVVAIDEGHHNFHTLSGRYSSLGKLLKADGYQLTEFKGYFTKEKLDKIDILIISNPLNEINTDGKWALPNPSAFNEEEIKALNRWVEEGGNVVLIADHMPFPGAAYELAKSFGIVFENVFAVNSKRQFVDLFTTQNGTMLSNPITQGIDTVGTFGGAAFKIIGGEHYPIIRLNADFTLVYFDTPRVYTPDTKKVSGEGFLHFAALPYHKGKIIVSGEAAMFSTQIASNGNQMGFNNPLAKSNISFILQLFKWF